MLPSISCLGSVYYGSNPSQLKRCLDSLTLNSYHSFEIVLVLDGDIGVDNMRVVDDFVDSSLISAVPINVNVGLGRALNIGLRHCSFDFIVRFDTDDVFTDDRIFLTAQYFDANPHIDVVTSPVCEFIPSLSPCVETRLRGVPKSEKILNLAFSYRNPINHPAVAFKKKSIVNVGSYESMFLFEDYFLWLKCRRSGLSFGVMNYITVFMRVASFGNRTGFRYARNEVSFVLSCAKRGLLPIPLLLLMPIRIFSRFFYSIYSFVQLKAPWRSKAQFSVNPDLATSLSPAFMGLPR